VLGSHHGGAVCRITTGGARAFLRLGVVLVALVTSFAHEAGGQVLGSADEDSVRAVIEATTAAFNAHDADAWARLCTADAQLVTVLGELMNGVAEIRKGLTTLFEGRNRNARVTTLDIRIRFARPDVALAYVTNELSGVVADDGRDVPPQREISLRVFVRDNGGWRMTAFHNTSLRQ
jgi:uncharacterized protein (TIGR02246 family)